MKKNNKKWITLMLAGALCGTAVIGSALLDNTSLSASADEVTYTLTDVFSAKDADIIGAKKQNTDDETETATFTFEGSDYVRIKRDLALKWYEGKNEAKYLTVKFSFADLNFTSMTFTMEGESSIATEKEKTTNVVKFTNENGKISATLIADGMKEADATTVETQIAADSELTLSLTETGDEAYDEYTVILNDGAADLNLGKFAHLGANVAEYTNEESKKVFPLEITAAVPEEQTSVLYLDEINNQRFDNVTTKTDSTVKVIKDTAPPVLVVNEEVNGFLLGTAFSLDYATVDVLQTSSLSETRNYYQYNPTHTAPNYDSKLTTSTYFMETTYDVEGSDVPTSVYQKNGAEYVAIRFTIGDNAYNADTTAEAYAKKIYELSWYANSAAIATKEQGSETKVTTDFIIVDENTEGPTYKYITADDSLQENVISDKAGLDAQIAAFEVQLEKAAEEVYAGSNAYIYFPSFDWLIDDNNGYRNLRFSISYKTATSNAQSSTNLAYNALKLSASEQGLYEFKIFAHDEASNTMKYYVDGELVDVTTTNIWDIEEIPSFSYEIKNRGLKVKDGLDDGESDRMETEILNQTYSFSGITIVGGTDQKTGYALYKVDLSAYNANLAEGKIRLTQSYLAGVSYAELGEGILGRLSEVNNETYNGDYLALYLDVYAGLLASHIGGEKDAVKACFTRIEKYDDRITEDDKTEWEAYNKYKWQKDSTASFATVEEGEYLIIADYWDSLLPTVSRTSAYKLVVVESEKDTIKGESEWLKNNLVSVILFAIAGVMLILIIILLLIKPSDETLQDVDEKAAAKKTKKKKSK